MDSTFTTTRHGRMHCRSVGMGTPLLLLHATPRSSRSFFKLIPLLTDRYRIIAPDTLGFGRSDPLPPQVSIEQLAESMVDVLDALAVQKAVVFGLHTGNKIGAALAAGWPERVARLIVCGMTHSIMVDGEAREAAIKAILEANPIDPNEVADPLEKRDRLEGQRSVDAMYAANYKFNLTAALRQLNVPALVVELATPLEAHLGRQGEALAELVSNGRSAVLERSDRDVLERYPEELAQLL